MSRKSILSDEQVQNNGEDEFDFGRNVREESAAEVQSTEQQTETEAPDPFDPASFRRQSNLDTGRGVQKLLLNVKSGKPKKSDWVRVHPAAAFRTQDAAVLEIEGVGQKSKECYLVAGHLHEALEIEPCYRPCLIATAIPRRGDVFLWMVNLPKDGDRKNDWTSSALEAIELATTCWVRVAANMKNGAYDVWKAPAVIPDPVWPEMKFSKLLRIAFKDYFIDSLDHPIVRSLQEGV